MYSSPISLYYYYVELLVLSLISIPLSLVAVSQRREREKVVVIEKEECSRYYEVGEEEGAKGEGGGAWLMRITRGTCSKVSRQKSGMM